MNATLHLPDCLPKPTGTQRSLPKLLKPGKHHGTSSAGTLAHHRSPSKGRHAVGVGAGSVVHLPLPGRSLSSSTNLDERRSSYAHTISFLAAVVVDSLYRRCESESMARLLRLHHTASTRASASPNRSSCGSASETRRAGSQFIASGSTLPPTLRPEPLSRPTESRTAGPVALPSSCAG